MTLWLYRKILEHTGRETLLSICFHQQAAAFSRVTYRTTITSTITWLNLTSIWWGRRGETHVTFNFNKKSWNYCQRKQEEEEDHVFWKEDQERQDRNIPNNGKSLGTPWMPCHIKSHMALQWKRKLRRISRLTSAADWAWERKLRQPFQVIQSKAKIVALTFKGISSGGGVKDLFSN